MYVHHDPYQNARRVSGDGLHLPPRPMTTCALPLAHAHTRLAACTAPRLVLKPTCMLIHGLLGHSYQFAAISRSLRLAGVRTETYDYRSRHDNLQGHAERLIAGQQWRDLVRRSSSPSAAAAASAAAAPPPPPFPPSPHASPPLPPCELPLFVTHSFGALVLREAFRLSQWEGPAKVVMCAPPNRGSEFCRRLEPLPLARWVVGEAGSELMGLGAEDLDARLGCLPREVQGLVIAGDLGWNPLISSSNDGTIAVEETRLPWRGTADQEEQGARGGQEPPFSFRGGDTAAAGERYTMVRAPHNLLLYHPHTVGHIKEFFGVR